MRALPHSRTAMPGDADKALALLRQSLALQPDYPAAHAAAAWCHEVRYMRGGLQEADNDLPPEKWTPGYAYFASACCGVM